MAHRLPGKTGWKRAAACNCRPRSIPWRSSCLGFGCLRDQIILTGALSHYVISHFWLPLSNRCTDWLQILCWIFLRWSPTIFMELWIILCNFWPILTKIFYKTTNQKSFIYHGLLHFFNRSMTTTVPLGTFINDYRKFSSFLNI